MKTAMVAIVFLAGLVIGFFMATAKLPFWPSGHGSAGPGKWIRKQTTPPARSERFWVAPQMCS
jgi:hypothetical protein